MQVAPCIKVISGPGRPGARPAGLHIRRAVGAAALESGQFDLARIASLHERRDVTFHATLAIAQILDFGEQLDALLEVVLASINVPTLLPNALSTVWSSRA